MSSNLIAMPFRPVLNLQGKFESGAILTVYKADTTTLQPIFEDEARTVPLSNPLTADGYGAFPPIYYDSDQPIRVVIQESNGAGLFDINPYLSSAFSAEEILTQAALLSSSSANSAVLAEQAATRAALSEATAEAIVGPTYADTTAGLAATVNGETFAVVSGDVVSIYLNNAGVAVLQRTILSATAVELALDGKAELVHTHAVSDVTGLQTALDAKAPLASPALTGAPTSGGIELGYRDVPRSTTATTLAVGDRGKCVAISTGITVPSAVFSEGAAVSIYNDSASSVTITQGSGLTLRLAGTATTGDRTLAQRGMATMWFNSASEAIISGPGLT